MSDQEELKQHFAQRVIHQAREVLEVWQQLQRSEWNDGYHTALTEATSRLRRFADRFEQTEHAELALNIEDCLGDIRDNRRPPVQQHHFYAQPADLPPGADRPAP